MQCAPGKPRASSALVSSLNQAPPSRAAGRPSEQGRLSAAPRSGPASRQPPAAQGVCLSEADRCEQVERQGFAAEPRRALRSSSTDAGRSAEPADDWLVAEQETPREGEGPRRGMRVLPAPLAASPRDLRAVESIPRSCCCGAAAAAGARRSRKAALLPIRGLRLFPPPLRARRVPHTGGGAALASCITAGPRRRWNGERAAARCFAFSKSSWKLMRRSASRRREAPARQQEARLAAEERRRHWLCVPRRLL